MTWKAGESGNPAGKPAGAANRTVLREAIRDAQPDVIEKLIELAKAGDIQALRILIDKGLPNAKPATQVELPELVKAGSPTDQARAVVKAIGLGLLSIEAGSQLLSGLGSAASIEQLDELRRRVAALETKEFT